jgi:hypothetical protein
MLKKSAKKDAKKGAMAAAAAKKRRALKAEAHPSFMGIPVADPAVRPRGTTVKKIREAVAAARKSA